RYNEARKYHALAGFHSRTARDVTCLRRQSIDPENLSAGPLSEVIERAVRSNMEINGTRDAGREAGRGTSSGIEDTNPATAQIGKEILTGVGGRELRHRRVIESGADNGAAGGIAGSVAVVVDRAAEIGITRRTFGYRPAVVRTGNSIVDFFPGRLANIIDEHAGRAWLKGEGKRVAQSKRPDRAIASRRGSVDWVSGRDAAIGIDAQHLPEQVGKSL